ncbi:hypothetical protein ELI03_36130 [Rhizobium leguminosarum]|uniref:Uncharacterized protein n=1 Tax=Rhizobium leguminosarum TaxID=384 RepID=A0A4Q8XP32_RHILE|nr:hypothetical protein [Rhizobium leguminosarum]TAX63653.1 hypothetical protein ELI03_36130 [Rhizobium leguminosarum]
MDERQKVAELSSRLEHLLRLRGLIDENGEIVIASGENLPSQLEDMLDGLVENAAELRSLIQIGRAVRRGEQVSAAVASAAKVMAAEVCDALYESFEGRQKPLN